MNTSMNPETRKRLRTSDLAAAGTVPPERDEFSDPAEVQTQSQAQALGQTSPAIPTLAAPGAVQLDDPRRAVADGDELVAEVMQSLAESFAHERQRLEDELSHTGEASTEALRVGLRRYRSFFERLLSL
jgi:hypothetical protein